MHYSTELTLLFRQLRLSQVPLCPDLQELGVLQKQEIQAIQPFIGRGNELCPKSMRIEEQNNTLWSFYFKVMAFFFRNIFAFPNRSVSKLLLQNNITDFKSNSEASLVLCRAPISHLMSWLMRQPLITFCVILLPKLKRCVPFSTWYMIYETEL